MKPYFAPWSPHHLVNKNPNEWDFFTSFYLRFLWLYIQRNLHFRVQHVQRHITVLEVNRGHHR